MARKELAIALSMIVANSPVSATVQQPTPTMTAPAGTPETRYCMHVAPVTGSLVQTIQCWTRAEWADQDVDVDKEWAKEGVAVIA